MLDAIVEWAPTDPDWTQLSEDLDAGIYWIVGTQARIADSSQKFEFCIGDTATVEACLPEPPVDSGLDDTGGEEPEPKVCGCVASPAAPGALALLGLFGLAAARKRRED